MAEYLFCNRPFSQQSLSQECGLFIDDLSSMSCRQPKSVDAYTPYLIKSNKDQLARNYLSQFSDHSVRHNLTELVLQYGGDATNALAGLYNKYGADFNVGMIGATASVHATRIDGFSKAVSEYQTALLAYHAAVKSKSSNQIAIKQGAYLSFLKLQREFKHELKMVAGANNSRRGTPLTNINRGLNIARDSRNAKKLFVADQAQANNLVRLSKYAKILGDGLVLLDVGSRVANIHSTYKNDGNWERELFVESSSFAASASTGLALVKVGSAALGFVMVATPLGWAGLIVGGLVVAGTAAAGSLAMNELVKSRAGGSYDRLMRSLR